MSAAVPPPDGAGDPGGGIVGVDVGGTFTDLVRLDPRSGATRIAKVPSTPANQADGVLDALDAAAVDLGALALIVHGTTTTTNALLERKLCRTGLITTRGFRDVLELGRRTRPAAYGMHGTFEPIVPRDLRLEVDERVDAAGAVRVPLDEAGVIGAGRRLLDAGCEAVLVHFLHAYANPAHERRAAELLGALWPNDHVCTGHELLSESREFERGVTAAVNAAVRPLLERYLSRLVTELGARGYAGEVLVVTGNGGTVSARHVARESAKTIMSGPASGVMAAARIGARAGYPNLVTYDMGGTSTDVALVRGAEPPISSEIELEHGLPIHVPMVDVRTIGAGGGSIARVTAGGLLEVGPASAGAVPGPICYGRGGTRPTLSDANFLLGRLDPASIPSLDSGHGDGRGRGGGRRDDNDYDDSDSDCTGNGNGRGRAGAEATAARRDAVARVFEGEIGAPLGLDATAAAAAVVRVANARMAGAVRMVSVSMGADPRDFALFAFGGAGPLHASAIARELGIPRVIVPPRPGLTNAIGCLLAPLRHDVVQTVNRPLDALDAGGLHALIARQVADGEAMILRQRVSGITIRHVHGVDMQFVGQTHLLRVPLANATPSIAELREAFARVYRERFRVELAGMAANLVNVATSVLGERALGTVPGIASAERDATASGSITARRVWLEDGWRRVPVRRREQVDGDVGPRTGPVLIEQSDTTILIEPGDAFASDADGNLEIRLGR